MEKILKAINPKNLSSVNKFKKDYNKNIEQCGWSSIRGGITFIRNSDEFISKKIEKERKTYKEKKKKKMKIMKRMSKKKTAKRRGKMKIAKKN